MNVTNPYKEQIIELLDEIDDDATKIGAVNTILNNNGKLIGYNTDIIGFELSLNNYLPKEISQFKALILGTGGASKAVCFVLEKMNIPYILVSQNPKDDQIGYPDIRNNLLSKHHLVINTTPLGMSPEINNFPLIPYQQLEENHHLYDLIYNPQKTLFLRKGQNQGAKIKNGLEMLIGQAEKSWEIWNSYLN